MAFDVVVVGAAGLDTLVFLPDAAPDWQRDSTMVRVVDAVGHAGAFTARGFAGLGWRTGFIGAFGEDWAATAVREAFARDGVVIAAEAVDPQGTARSVNLMTPDGARRAFYDGRGHSEVPVPAGAEAAFNGTRLAVFHLSDWCRHLLPAARAAGCVIATDLQDVADLDDPYRADFLAASDIVFLSGAHLADAAQLAERLAAATPTGDGPVLAVVGMGSAGAMAWQPGRAASQPPPRLDLPVTDTNGAGDALLVGFLDALVLGGATRPDADPSSQPTRESLLTVREEALLRALAAGQTAARRACASSGGELPLTREALDDALRGLTPAR